MQGVFINLDRSEQRRMAMESQLQRLGMHGIRRMPAIDGHAVAAPPSCSISPGELGCFLSHLNAIEQAAADAFTFIFEDDLELAEDLPLVMHPGQLGALSSFDIVMLDCQPEIGTGSLAMLWQTVRRQLTTPADLATAGSARRVRGVEILDGRSLYCWGATAYLVTPRGRARLPALLRECLDRGPSGPVDILFAHAMQDGRISAAVLVPFLATPRLESLDGTTMAQRSQSALHLAVASAIRRMFFAGPLGDMESFVRPLLQPDLDPQQRIMRDLVGQAFVMQLRDGDFVVDGAR